MTFPRLFVIFYTEVRNYGVEIEWEEFFPSFLPLVTFSHS